nr:reverse transcriptase domain-containing protein [Tanacetum cinerariifolium]
MDELVKVAVGLEVVLVITVMIGLMVKVVKGCTYKEFLACNPKEYDGKAGMSWEDFKSLTREEFCPSNEMQKLETELWNHTMVGAGHAAYTHRFHELARLVPHLVTPKGKRIERVGPMNVNLVNARNPTARACYECGSTNHVKAACRSKDRPPMLAPGNYVQWKSKIKRYIDTKPNHERIHYCLKNPPYKLSWADKEVLISEGSSVTTTERHKETYKNVSQDIRDQLNAEAEAVQIILAGIDNDIYSTVDACPNACEMNQCDVTNHQVNIQFLLQLQPEWQRFVTLVKQSQELKTVSYHKLYDILKQHQNEVNEIRAERIARVANPLALDNSPRINISTGYENRKSGNVAGAMETVGSTVVQKSGIQCYDCKKFGHVARECQKPKRVKDAAYHREKMLLCKQEEARIQLNAEQTDWMDDTDDELEDQKLEAHYMYMAQLQEVSPDAADSGPIFDSEPLQKVSNDDHYNVFAIESEHPEQSESIRDTYPIEQDEHNIIIDSLDMSYDREQIDQNDDDNDLDNERELLASLIEKLKCEINDIKNRNKFLETSNKFLNEIDRLLREYYYADHMNAILGMYTELYEVTNLQCDYLEFLQKCECLEKEFSKSKMMSKRFETVQKHAINLELELQQCKEKMKNDKSFKVNQSKEFCKEGEQYFEIQDLKAQLQDKGIVIRVIPTTSVSRPQLKSNPMGDRVMHNNCGT